MIDFIDYKMSKAKMDEIWDRIRIDKEKTLSEIEKEGRFSKMTAGETLIYKETFESIKGIIQHPKEPDDIKAMKVFSEIERGILKAKLYKKSLRGDQP